MIFQLGVAGFCFGNIMLMSFPEYLGIDASESGLRSIFRWMNLALSLPVFLYAAQPFYISSWKSLSRRFLNIDAPIALAIIITFVRSAYEVISGTGGGYFDSMTGIVFFMLAGRVLQDKTYRQLSFDRDYTSYFPVAVSVLHDQQEMITTLPELKPGNTLLIHNEELIPTDGILTRGTAFIDYSFVTGESVPVLKEVGELVYAGGKQTGGNIEILVIKEVAQSYLTRLWNADVVTENTDKKRWTAEKNSFVQLLSHYFTYIVLTIAATTAIYWQVNDLSKTWSAVTAIFIIACPCALLLSSTFTNGNILQILSRNKFYLRNAQMIEEIAKATHIVFDKTGTLTSTQHQHIHYEGAELSSYQLQQVAAVAGCSSHPLSKALAHHLTTRKLLTVAGFKETVGQGIEGFVNDDLVKIGSYQYVTGKKERQTGTAIFVSFEGMLKGFFVFHNHYREKIPGLIRRLGEQFKLSVLSGDNESEEERLVHLFGTDATLRFYQGPEDKLRYIKHLQATKARVIMIGDGLNDAGALKQSNVGIAVAEQSNNFTPSSDAIIGAEQLPKLYQFIHLCRNNRSIIHASFILSIVYNIIGLFFAIQGNLSPLLAAILMPSSSLSILLLTFGASNIVARRLKL
jgi:Cu+-exporting ATPase